MGDVNAALAQFLASQTATNTQLTAAHTQMATAQAELTATVQPLATKVDRVAASLDSAQAQLAALRTNADQDRAATRTAVTTAVDGVAAGTAVAFAEAVSTVPADPTYFGVMMMEMIIIGLCAPTSNSVRA